MVKLLRQDMTTHGNYKWKVGKWQEPKGKKSNWSSSLCNKGWLHYYPNKYIAVLMNPYHANISSPLCFACETDGDVLEDGMKCGARRLKLGAKVELPRLTTEQVETIIRLVKLVYKDEVWSKWANNWLSGEDRTEDGLVVWAMRSAALAVDEDADVLSFVVENGRIITSAMKRIEMVTTDDIHEYELEDAIRGGLESVLVCYPPKI